MNTEIDKLTQNLAEASTPSQLHAAVVALSKPGSTTKASRDPAFAGVLARLEAMARSAPQVDRLVAIAIIARLRKQQNKPFDPRFEKALRVPMPPLEAGPQSLEDPKERDYLAQGLRLINFDDRIGYLARFIASEGQTRTDARDTAAQILVEDAATLDEVFNEIGEPLGRQLHETQDPATSRVRRLIRVLESVREALRHVEPHVTPSTGLAYARLLQANLNRSAERAVLIEVTNAALELLLAWLRPNFSVALDPDAFGALRVLQAQFAPARWPDETMESRRDVARLVREAIALLAQAGVTDDRLRKAVEVVMDETTAAMMLRQLAKEQPGLANDVRHWLETGRAQLESTSAAAVMESVLETVDRDLAEAFRESEATRALLEGVAGEISEAVAMSNPTVGEGLDELVARIGRLTRRIEAVAAKRQFQLEGEAGSIVEYAPTSHVANRPIAGVRNVRIVSPMVVRLTGGGAPQIITKAKVEEA